MSLKSSLTIYKLSTVTLLSSVLVIGFKYHESVGNNQKLKEESKIDRLTYTNDLKEILNRYDAEVQKNRVLMASADVVVKEEVVKNKEVYTLQEKIVVGQTTSKKYLQKIDSFQEAFQRQKDENVSLQEQVALLRDRNKELNKKNAENESIIAVSKNLTATNIVANGVKIVGNNIIETKKFNATQQVKVCFTLLENKAAVKGNKDIYIQIINPEGKVVSKNDEVYETRDQLLRYSARTNVYYDNDEVDVCVFVDPNKNQMSKGDYEINIYSGINLIGNTVFTLK